ncbi:dolichol kinase [Coemansia spiralis]|uniref:dolichol kinase n=1 Tax=Coemansia spiralis TaxID=417178 RepID=A0A9W8KY32_9FUNG|nr:dolichol kinase [Coemansia spiralis]
MITDSCGGNKSKSGRGMRLYNEACIPVALFIVSVIHHGIAPNIKNDDEAGVESYAWWQPRIFSISSFTASIVVIAMALVPLFLRLEWGLNGGGLWILAARDSSARDVVLPRTKKSMYRPSADDGMVWGIVLVPLVVRAADLADTTSDTLGIWSRTDIFLVSLAMALRITISVVSMRIKHVKSGKANGIFRQYPIILLFWIAAILVLGHVGSMPGLAGHSSLISRLVAMFASAEAQEAATVYIISVLPRSFTLGEASVFAQGTILIAIDLIGKLALRIQTTDLAKHSVLWKPHMEALCLEAAVPGLLLLVHLLAASSNSMRVGGASGQTDTSKSYPMLTKTCVLIVFCGVLSLLLIAYISCTNPLVWTLGVVFGSTTNLILISYWTSLLAGGSMFYTLAVSNRVADSHNKFVLHLKRKSYHLLSVLMFVPGFLLARQFLHFAFTVALVLFVAVEAVRALDISPWGPKINMFISKFTDHRDAGQIVTSHFYLLFGCALPVWLGGPSTIACLAGVLSLGLADTAASLAGMKLGRVRWPGTAKTFEGTAGFVVSLFSAALLVEALASGISSQRAQQAAATNDVIVQEIDNIGPNSGGTAIGAIGYLILCTVLSVLEALTEQNDNLVVPLFMYSAMMLFAGLQDQQHHSLASASRSGVAALLHTAACFIVAAILAFMPHVATAVSAAVSSASK